MTQRKTQANPHPRAGPVEIGDGEVAFGVFAPGKTSVELLAEFNEWTPGADPLEPLKNGLWTLRKRLNPGRHAYKFLIDNRLEVCDPWAREVEHDPASLQPFAVIHTGREPFVWRHEEWNRPALSGLIIYELHIGDFSPEGTFEAVLDRLDYLQNLGVNAIEFLPVQEARDYWGYQPTFFFAPRRAYGTADDFKRLVDEAHGRGIAVILDVVFAHTAITHPFNVMYYDERNSPWYGKPLGRPNQFHMPSLSFQKPATLEYFREVQAHWLNEFRVDGLRYDYVASIAGNRKGEGMPWLVKTAKQIKADVYCIGEWLPEDAEKVARFGLDAVWHGAMLGALRSLSGETEVKGYSWRRFKQALQALDHAGCGYRSASFMINYVETHDDHRVVRTAMRRGFDLDTAMKKSALLATVLMTAAGQPMLYNGQEWGERSERRKNRPNKLRWELLATNGGSRLRRHVRAMCRLRRSFAALSAGSLEFAAIDGRNKTAIWHRVYGTDRVVIAANFSGLRRTVKVRFPDTQHTDYWREYFSHHALASAAAVERELLPYSAEIYFPIRGRE